MKEMPDIESQMYRCKQKYTYNSVNIDVDTYPIHQSFQWNTYETPLIKWSISPSVCSFNPMESPITLPSNPMKITIEIPLSHRKCPCKPNEIPGQPPRGQLLATWGATAGPG